ncbi:hypothetical protein JHW43_003944 [Diplocarpon mali]|nr:hypothetical protein JHW43_003944 [Diplocarpon mali]
MHSIHTQRLGEEDVAKHRRTGLESTRNEGRWSGSRGNFTVQLIDGLSSRPVAQSVPAPLIPTGRCLGAAGAVFGDLNFGTGRRRLDDLESVRQNPGERGLDESDSQIVCVPVVLGYAFELNEHIDHLLAAAPFDAASVRRDTHPGGRGGCIDKDICSTSASQLRDAMRARDAIWCVFCPASCTAVAMVLGSGHGAVASTSGTGPFMYIAGSKTLF